MNTIEQLKIDEGFSGTVYLDTVGKHTVGYGRNLDDNPLTELEAENLLMNDVNEVIKECIKLDFYEKLSTNRKGVIINMVFNMGMSRFKQFKKTIQAIKDNDYEKAGAEMLDSKWATQVGIRSIRLSDLMVSG